MVDQLLSALGRQKISVPVEQGPTLLLYEKKDRTSAMLEANHLRQQGCSVVLMEQKDTMEAYEAYGERETAFMQSENSMSLTAWPCEEERKS